MIHRYQLLDASPQDWQEAENQIKSGKSTSVVVKGKDRDSKKRKPGEALADAHKEAEKIREKKKHKKGKT
jgi:N-acetyltransferase 10